MKIIPIVLVALCALLTGCASTVQKNAATFLQNLPNINAADITQTTSTPVFSHTESVANLVTSPGSASVSNVKAEVVISPGGIPWYKNTFSASSVTVTKPDTAPAQAPAAQAPAATPATEGTK